MSQPSNPIESVVLRDDGETGQIEHLTFRSRNLHRLLSAIEADRRGTVIQDALSIGGEVLARAAEHGDLQNLERALARLDEESKRIVEATTEQVERAVDKTVADLGLTIQADDGPMAALLSKFDPAAKGNVIDVFRDLVTNTTRKATSQAVAELSEAAHETMERLAKSVAALDKVAAAEEARLLEMAKGTAKGLDHEFDVETLLGELVAVGGDSLDDVSTVPGLLATKKGDKTITPRGGCIIVTEEKCTSRISEAKARVLLDEAKANRAADLAMLIVDDQSKVPGNQPFHLIDDDKVVVVANRLALRLVYSLFRAKAIELARTKDQVDDVRAGETVRSIHPLVEEISRALSRFRLLRTEHTKATKAIQQAGGYADEIALSIANDVDQIMIQIEHVLKSPAQDAA